MKKVLVIFGIIFLAINLFSFVNADSNCTDTDGGVDLYTKGTVFWNDMEGNPQETTDLCLENKVMEAICKGESAYNGNLYPCLEGEICFDGACIEGEYEACVDLEENGPNPEMKGMIIYHGIQYFDNCYSPSILTELSCGEDNVEINYLDCKTEFGEEFACSEGACKQCLNDGCIEIYPFCNDTDGGKDVYTKGKLFFLVDDKWEEFSDKCSSDMMKVIEYSCDTNPYVTKYVDCKYGCQDGACGLPPNLTFEEFIPSEPVECSDSDGGANIYEKGTAESEGQSFVDECGVYNGKDVVNEAVCESTGAKTIELSCLNGCKDGACIEGEEQGEEVVGEENEVIIEEENREPFLSEDCWDRNRNDVVDTIEDINFDGDVDVFDCLVVYNDRELIKNKINDYIGEISRTTSFLIGGADIEIIVEGENNLLFDVELTKGNVTDFVKDEGKISPNYIIRIDNENAKDVLLSTNPRAMIIEAYKNDKLKIEPQTFGAKIKYFFVDKLNLVGNIISKL